MNRIAELNIPSYWLKRLACFAAAVLVPYVFLLLTLPEFTDKGILGAMAYVILFALLSPPALMLAVSLVPGVSSNTTDKFSDCGTIGLILQILGVSSLFFTMAFMGLSKGSINQMLHLTLSFLLCVLSGILLFSSAIASLEAIRRKGS